MPESTQTVTVTGAPEQMVIEQSSGGGEAEVVGGKDMHGDCVGCAPEEITGAPKKTDLISLAPAPENNPTREESFLAVVDPSQQEEIVVTGAPEHMGTEQSSVGGEATPASPKIDTDGGSAESLPPKTVRTPILSS